MDSFLLILRVGLSLTVVMVLLWMAQKRFSRGGRHQGQAVVEVIGRRNVGQKASVVVVESDGQRFLLGVTENSINVLHTSEAPMPSTGSTDGPDGDPAFEQVLKAAGEPPLRRDAAARRMRHSSAEASALHGTIFARSTWTQAGAAVKKGMRL